MHIINLCEQDSVVKKKSTFKVVFQDKNECCTVANEIDLLSNDGWNRVWDCFKGQQAQKLLNNAVDGLIVFLSCQRENNIISGEFFSLDEKADSSLFKNYIHEVQSDAQIDINQCAY